MKWQLRLSGPAREDIHQILRHTPDRFGQAKHDEYKALIRQALIDIASAPQKHPARARPELNSDIVTFHIGRPGKRARHLFIYRIVERDVIEVARLLHDAMDVPRHVPDEFTK